MKVASAVAYRDFVRGPVRAKQLSAEAAASKIHQSHCDVDRTLALSKELLQVGVVVVALARYAT